jgi:hypothetical protein
VFCYTIINLGWGGFYGDQKAIDFRLEPHPFSYRGQFFLLGKVVFKNLLAKILAKKILET